MPANVFGILGERAVHLESRVDNDMVIIHSTAQPTSTNIFDIFNDLVLAACSVRYLAKEYGIEQAPLELNLSEEFQRFLPKREPSIGGHFWTVHRSVFELAERLYPNIIRGLLPFPRTDLPNGVASYPIDNDLLKETLFPFILLNDDLQRFTLTSEYMARINGGDVNRLRELISQSGLDGKLTVLLLDGGDIILKGWVESEDKRYVSRPDSDSLIALYAALKSFYGIRIIFTSLTGFSSLKLIKNSLWTTQPIVDALIRYRLLGAQNFRKEEALRVNQKEIHKYTLTQSGFDQVVAVFGSGILSSEFIVRPFRKAEIISADRNILNTTLDILEQNPGLFRINQRSISNLAFESLSTTPYLDIMKVYFTLKFHHGIVLVSEMDPQRPKMGIEAFEHISSNTEFGGGVAPIHIISVKTGGQIKNFLIGYPAAIDALLDPLPEAIKQDIQLDEIESGVTARRIGNKVYTYLQFMLQ